LTAEITGRRLVDVLPLLEALDQVLEVLLVDWVGASAAARFAYSSAFFLSPSDA